MQKGKIRDKLSKFVALTGLGKLSEELRKLIAIVVLEIIVFGLAFGIVVSFFPDYTYIYDAIMIFFVSAIGITVMLYGNATRNRYLNVLGLLILLFAVYIMIETIEGFAVKISAFATLAVAIAAFAAIEENRRIRQDSTKRESRDKRERLVAEVAKWLRELWGRVFPARSTLMSTISEIEARMKGSKGIELEKWLKIKDTDTAIAELGSIAEAMKEAEYYEKLTLQMDKEFSKLIGVVRNKLEERLIIRFKEVESLNENVSQEKKGKSKGELKKDASKASEESGASAEDSRGELDKNMNDMRESIKRAIEKAIELKIELININ